MIFNKYLTGIFKILFIFVLSMNNTLIRRHCQMPMKELRRVEDGGALQAGIKSAKGHEGDQLNQWEVVFLSKNNNLLAGGTVMFTALV